MGCGAAVLWGGLPGLGIRLGAVLCTVMRAKATSGEQEGRRDEWKLRAPSGSPCSQWDLGM